MYERLDAESFTAVIGDLSDVVWDAVVRGSSIGFLRAEGRPAVEAWWRDLLPDVAAGRVLIWVARVDGRVAGTVQLRPGRMPNSRHRAELAKLVVHADFRRRGVGRALLEHAEREAVAAGLELLVLDTEVGSPPERLYRAAGWREVGIVPAYADDPDGARLATRFFHKPLA